MGRSRIEYTDHFAAVMDKLTSGGLLLGSYDASGKPNIMTIGWGSLGSIWGMPIWTVLVRPSRHTFKNLEHTGCFTVNVPADDLSMACATCGTLSGRDTDKFAECDLTAEKAATVLAPTVAQCPIIYECQIIHSNDILPEKLDHEILTGSYISGDYHRVYFGKVLAVYADDDAAERLR